jgi:cobalt/nickel transport system permease protein
MVGGHLLFGFVELVVTALVVAFLQVQDPSLLGRETGGRGMKTTTKLWIGVGVLAVLTPIGLYVPQKFKAGSAWGEWGAEEMQGLAGYIPHGLKKLGSLWSAPMPDYAFKGWENSGLKHLSIAYVVSAIVGIGICVGLAFLLGKLLSKKERRQRSRKKAGGFLERTIEATVSLLKETVSVEQVAAKNGFLQRRDPRFKCLGAMLFLTAVLMSKSVIELSVIYVAILCIVLVSAIGLFFFLKRTLLFIPIFSFFIVVPAIFSVVTPGEPVASFKLIGWTVAITRQGIDSAAIFCMRVLDSVSIAVLLVLTTRQHVLLKTLRVFRVPQLFVMTIGMTCRYIFLFLEIIQNMFVAIKSRVGFVSSARDGRRVVTSNMAGLWLRSYRMQSLVYDAMLARGFTGEAFVLDDFHARAQDIILFSTALAVLIGTLWLNLFFR